MYQRSDRIALFDHYAACLGPVACNWHARTIPKEDFRVLGFDPVPAQGRRALCTFGLSDHCLHAPGANAGTRLEYMFAVDAACEVEEVAALLIAIGDQALRRGYSPGLHGVIEGRGPVLFGGNPLFEHFYLASPLAFPAGFAECDSVAPATLIVQLIPISSAEKHIIETRGWQVFEHLLAARADLPLFDRREELA